MDAVVQYFVKELIKISWLSSAAITLIGVYLSILVIKKRQNFKRLSQELGYQVPEINNALMGHLNEYNSIEKQAEWNVRFGKIYGFYNCDKPHLRVADLDAINEIFLKQSRNFIGRTWNEYRLTPFNMGILFSYDSRWRDARRLFHSAMSIYRMTSNHESSQINVELLKGTTILLDHFEHLTRPNSSSDNDRKSSLVRTEPRVMPSYTEIDQIGFVVVEDQNSPTGYSIDFKAHIMMEVIALDIILRVGLDVHDVDVLKGLKDPMMKSIHTWLGAVDDPMGQVATAIPLARILMPFYLMMNKNFLDYFKYMIRLFNRHNNELAAEEKLTAQEDGQHSNDSDSSSTRSILKVLVGEYRAGRMRKREVIAHAGATIVAGFETTATTSSYILWCIARYPELKERLLKEVLEFGIHSRYLDMFIKEVMRMYPALANFVIRSPKDDTKVNGRLIKRGMSVYLGVNTIHYDETIYPDPYKFDPERFAEGKTYPPGAYVPFGLGHRMCVGYHLAMREMKIIVVEIMKRFDIALIAPQLELERECLTIFLTHSKNEIRIRLIPRVKTNE